MIGIGSLRQVMTIQNEVTTISAEGKRIITWVDAETIWADIQPIGRAEEFQYTTLEVRTTHKIIMRYTPTLTPTSRLLWGTRILTVSRIRNLGEQNIKLEVLAWELM